MSGPHAGSVAQETEHVSLNVFEIFPAEDMDILSVLFGSKFMSGEGSRARTCVVRMTFSNVREWNSQMSH